MSLNPSQLARPNIIVIFQLRKELLFPTGNYNKLIQTIINIKYLQVNSVKLNEERIRKHGIYKYRLGTVNSKSFVSKFLLRIKWKFELTVHFKHEMLGK